MTLYLENEVDFQADFDLEEIAAMVINQVLDQENCPYETELNLLITDDDGIREFNREYREIDRETDVLSFPNLFFEAPAEFEMDDAELADYVNPDTGEIILGDIILNKMRILSQAEEYGHSIKREYAFLIAHSMLHLCGYDHMEPDEAKVMEEKQEEALKALGITRDI